MTLLHEKGNVYDYMGVTMRIATTTDLTTSRPCIRLEHRGDHLLWNAKVYNNMSNRGGEPADITRSVKHINDYWGRLSIERQDKIFAVYKEIRGILDEIADIHVLMVAMRKLVKKLYELHPWEEMCEYVDKFAKIKLPLDLKEAHGIDAPNTPQTYLKHEYVGLIKFLFQLRVMLPIWGEHVNRIAVEVPSYRKEYYVASALNMSRLVDCPYYLRYQSYVNTFIGGLDDKQSLPVVMSGMGTNEIPAYVFSISMIRRLACCELVDWSMPDDPTHVISMIYNFIKSKDDQAPRTFSSGQVIKDKRPDGEQRGEDPDNTSTAEGFKIREPISAATLEMYNVYMARTADIIKRIEPGIADGMMDVLIEEYSNAVILSRTYDPSDIQLVLVQWCLRFVVPPRSIPHLDYEATTQAVVATCVLLSHWGFADLALLLSGSGKLIPETMMAGHRRTPLTKEQIDQLVVLYPHYQMPKLKRDQRTATEHNPHQQYKQNVANNVAIWEINELAKEFNNFEWDVVSSLSVFPQNTMQRGNRGYLSPETLRNQLASLVIKLATHNKKD